MPLNWAGKDGRRLVLLSVHLLTEHTFTVILSSSLGERLTHLLWRLRIRMVTTLLKLEGPLEILPAGLSVFLTWEFSGSSVGKESACSAGDSGSIPGSGRSPGEGNSNLLQDSCLENPMEGGVWRATVHGIARVGHSLVTKPPQASS